MTLMDYHANPTGAGPSTTEFVWIPSGDAQLAASVDLPAGGDTRGWPVVVLIHGFSGHRIGRSYHFVELGRALAATGIACIRFDQAGCGESTGEQTQYSLATIERDCRCVHDWLTDDGRFDVDHIGVLGVSMGSLAALALDAERPVKAIALWAPVFDLPALVSERLGDYELSAMQRQFGFAPYRGVKLGHAYFDQLARFDARRLLESRRSPLLVIHCRDDAIVPVSHGRAIAAACESCERACEFLPLDDTGHDFYLEPTRSKVIRVTTKWLARQLTPRAID